MGLVRELKALNARKKAGEELSPPEEARRKELKTFLKAQLEGGGAAPAEEASVSQPRPPVAAPPSPPPPPSRPAPPPEPAAAPRPVTAVAAPVKPKPASQYVPKKDAFAIAGADDILNAAANSEAVKKTDGWANRKAVASDSEIADAEAAADAAIRATKKRERAVSPEDVENQLKEIGGAYTPPAEDFVMEQYYSEYYGEGLQLADMSEAQNLKPIDPRELQFRAALDVAVGPGSGATTVTVPPGLAFLDDFPQLYAARVLQPPSDGSSAAEDPSLLIGRRKVTIHMLNGAKKQGAVRALRRGELGLRLEVAGGVEEVALQQVKAVFVHLQPNAQPSADAGRTITVLFRDQRTVQGASNDFEPGAPVFSLVPPAGRGQFEKIIINASAVASVT